MDIKLCAHTVKLCCCSQTGDQTRWENKPRVDSTPYSEGLRYLTRCSNTPIIQKNENTKRSTLSLVAKSTDCAKIPLKTKKSLLLFFSISAYLGPRQSKSNKGNFSFILSHCIYRQLRPLARWAQERRVHWLASSWARRLWSHRISRQKLYLYCLPGQLQPGANTLLRTVLSHEPKTEPPTSPCSPH